MNFPYYRIYNWCLICQWIFFNTCTLIKQDFDARWQIWRFLRFLGWRWAGHRTYSSKEEMFCCPRRHCGHNLQPLLVSRGGQGHGMLKYHDLIGGGGGEGEQGICEKKLSYDETFQSDMDFDVIVGWGSSDDSSRESTQNYTAWRGRHLWPVIEKSQCQGCIAKVSDISQYHIHYYEFYFTLTNVTI